MTGGLDPFPSLSRIRELHRERTGRELVLDGEIGPHRAPEPPLPPASKVKAVTAGLNGEPRRVEGELLFGGGLHLLLPIPPRSKKNHTTLGIKQAPAYRAYRDFIIAMLAPLLGPLGLPLHPMPYNIAALYYVDVKGKRADLVGLHQGLFDALENADVISDDLWFYTTDGSRVIRDDPNPRVDVTITPLDDPHPPRAV
jgi:Holliday junction resolvase RusA-like endonuclease